MASPSQATRPRSTAATRPQGRNSAKGRAPVKARKSAKSSIFVTLFGGIQKFATAVWLGVAHVVGAITRSVGRSARDLDPAHRRDGLGLLYLSLAIVVASVIWFDVTGFVAGVVTSLVTGAVGIFDLFAPVVLIVIAVQTLRHPDAPSQKKGRLTIGWTLFALSTMGITHIQRGNPLPSDGAQAMREAAGWTGWAITAPFVSAIGTVVTVMLLLVVFFFAILIITATPINTIPVKLRAFKSKFSRIAIDDEAEAAAHPNVEAISAAQAQLALDVTPVVHRTILSRLRRKSKSDATIDPALAIGELAGDAPFATPVVRTAPVVSTAPALEHVSEIVDISQLNTIAVDVLAPVLTHETEAVQLL